MARTSKRPDKLKISVNRTEVSRVNKTPVNVNHKSFKLTDLPKIDNSGLPSSFSLFWQTLKDIYRYRWQTFFFIISYGFFWYGFVYADSSSAASGIFGMMVGIIASLAGIWIVRHREAGQKLKIRDGYYKGMVQLIPFFLIIILLTLQLAPSYVGFAVFDTALKSGAVVTVLEYSVPLIVWIFLTGVSLYWTTATLMSIYVATIPGVLPMEAIRSGKKMVDGRRWFVFRRLLIGGLFMVATYLSVGYLLSSQNWDGAVRQLSVIFPILVIPFLHTYMFKIYNSLLEKI